MKKSIILLLSGSVFVLLLSLLNACSKNEVHFFLKDFDTHIQEDRSDSTAYNIVNIEEGDTCDYQYFQFFINEKRNVLANQTENKVFFDFISKANAYSPAPARFINQDPIKEIRLISFYDYNDIEAGQDLSAYIPNKEKVLKSLNDFKMYADEMHHYFTIDLLPEQISQQQFVIELISENNTILRDTTVTFYIKP